MLDFIIFTDQYHVTTHFQNDESTSNINTYQDYNNPSFVIISWPLFCSLGAFREHVKRQTDRQTDRQANFHKYIVDIIEKT
jgi:hypothetical protein